LPLLLEADISDVSNAWVCIAFNALNNSI